MPTMTIPGLVLVPATRRRARSGRPTSPGWLDDLAGHRMLTLDQRGTDRSTPSTSRPVVFAAVGVCRFGCCLRISVDEAAEDRSSLDLACGRWVDGRWRIRRSLGGHVPVPCPRSRWQVRRLVRRRPRRRGHRGGEDPAADAAGELPHRTVRTHCPPRVHRPGTDLRRRPRLQVSRYGRDFRHPRAALNPPAVGPGRAKGLRPAGRNCRQVQRRWCPPRTPA